MPSWLRRIVHPLSKPKKPLKLLQGEALRPPSKANSVVTETHSEAIEPEDIVEKYERRLLAELEELAKNCRRQNYLDDLHTLNPTIATLDMREENFERLWSKARSRVDGRLTKTKQKHSSRLDGLSTGDALSYSCRSNLSTRKSNRSDEETLTSDLDTLNDYSWRGMECTPAVYSTPIIRVQRKMKKGNNVVSSVRPRCLGE
ncbi:conserved hypothetical protein [Echinococcus multilocularis]|uniref:Uncharacterized protein n=1 Tax=Echinococcus multilocularis TaxID=6211 RepID=A0A068Y6D4_ECHMU|nr:conserved hypothetical protein [Echinococcus multilocularis]